MKVKATGNNILINVIKSESDSSIILTDKPKFMLGVVLSVGKDVKVPLEENTTLMFTPGDIKIVKIGEVKHCCFIVEDAIIGVFDE